MRIDSTSILNTTLALYPGAAALKTTIALEATMALKVRKAQKLTKALIRLVAYTIPATDSL
jgi:hypothetical protein